MKKLEKVIRDNLNLEIPMKYPKPRKQVYVWKYCLPLVMILLLGTLFYQSKKPSISNVFTKEDSIIINQVHFNSSLNRIDCQLEDCFKMCEINKKKDLLTKIPLVRPWIKDWIFEYYFHQYKLTYHKNDITLNITIVKEDENLVRYEKDLQVSMIAEIPVTISYYDDYYQASFINQGYFYYVISNGIEESTFVQSLKQMIGEIK